MRKVLAGIALVAGLAATVATAAECRLMAEGVFNGEEGPETVRLGRGAGLPKDASFGVFKAPLAVNTDGAPTSYHPEDFRGERLAINRIDNGVTIKKTDGTKLTVAQKVAVFDSWRDAGWVVPSGYTIAWTNVIADDGHGKPCVFTGDNAGYFGSLTALKNELSGVAAGECGVKNQLDQRFIPAIVLRGGGQNPLHGFGARKGDLVLAINPANSAIVAAIIGDTGDAKRIGEGSVALNMALLGKSKLPTTYAQALGLDTGTKDMVVAVVPGSRGYEPVRPFTRDNIAERLRSWAGANGYGDLDGLAAMALTCSQGL